VVALFLNSDAVASRTTAPHQALRARAKTLRIYALAFAIVALGFLIRGVPSGATETTPEPTADSQVESDITATSTQELQPDGPATFVPSGPLGTPTSSIPTPAVTAAPPVETATPEATATPSSTSTPTNTPTSTPSATPTASPTPTITPTPIVGETANLDTGGSTLWLSRVPGGEQLDILHHGDLVILMGGHANYDGSIWREIRTLAGVVGWVPEQYLVPTAG